MSREYRSAPCVGYLGEFLVDIVFQFFSLTLHVELLTILIYYYVLGVGKCAPSYLV